MKCDSYMSTKVSYPIYQVRVQLPECFIGYSKSIVQMRSSSPYLTRAKHFGGSDSTYPVCAQLAQKLNGTLAFLVDPEYTSHWVNFG